MTTPYQKDVYDLDYFFELSADLLCIAGYDGYFRRINPAVSKTLGYTNEELMARPISSFVHLEDQGITAKTRNTIIIKNNKPLLNFENRYLTKSGKIVWLSWTSMPVEKDELVFAIAKNITVRKRLEEHQRIANLLSKQDLERKKTPQEDALQNTESKYAEVDQAWLSQFEALVRKYTGKFDLNISLLSSELAMSERQLFRRIKLIMGITPNQYIRVIRLQLAMEAIESGKYRTVTEISHAAGFETPGYFSKLFKEIYDVNVAELLSRPRPSPG